LLVIQAGVPDGEFLLAITGVVVTVSVLVHGASATPLSTLYGRAVEASTLEEQALERRRWHLRWCRRRDGPDQARTTLRNTGERRPTYSPRCKDPLAVRNGQDPRPRQHSGHAGPVEEWARDREKERGSQVEGQRIVAYCT